MKKIQILAMALLVAAGMSSCSNNKKAEAAAETAEPQAEYVAPAPDYSELATAFRDSSKKSDVATDTTYAVTPSGLKYMILTEGKGKQPTAESSVTVHYTGELLNGEVFDSSVSRGEPATFPLNRVIPGWTEGVQLMKEGAKYTFFIPSDLAYGAQGVPGAIPPHSTLIFEVELIKVNKK